MPKPAERRLSEIVAERFGGKLLAGAHAEDGHACVLEACSVARGVAWTDNPEIVGLPDLRSLNDSEAWPDDATRARCLIPVAEALWDWPTWDDERRVAWARRVALRTVREVLPLALEAAGLTQEAKVCRDAEGLEAASWVASWAAARAAAAAAERAAELAAADASWAAATAWVADAAAEAAEAAARAGLATAEVAEVAWAGFPVLELACRIWIESGARIEG